jgi:chromosome segregation ATPase
LTRSLSAAERAVKQLESDKDRIIRDVQAARDLSLTISRTKEDTQRQLEVLSEQLEASHKTIARFESERESLSAQMRAERAKVERLETLLQAERTRKFQTEKSALELAADKGQMQERLQARTEEQISQLAKMKKELDLAIEESDALRIANQTVDKELGRTKKGVYSVSY